MADYNSAEAGIDVFEIIDGLPVSSDWKSFLTHHNDAKRLSKTDLLILDDWGLEKMTLNQRNDLLEIMEDRHGLKSTLITSQLPITQWHKAIGDATLADAILDRLLHNSHKLKLKGESMRKVMSELTESDHSQ